MKFPLTPLISCGGCLWPFSIITRRRGGGWSLSNGSSCLISRFGVLKPSHLSSRTIPEEIITKYEIISFLFHSKYTHQKHKENIPLSLSLSLSVYIILNCLNLLFTYPLSFLAAILKMMAGLEVVSICAEASWL